MEKHDMNSDLTLLDLFKILWKYRKFIVIFTIIATLIGIAFIYFRSFSGATVKLKKSTEIKNYIYSVECAGIFDFEVYNNIKKYVNYYTKNNFFNQIRINFIDFYPYELSKDYRDNPYYYPVYKINFIFNKSGKFENEEKIKLNNFIKNVLFYSYIRNKMVNPFNFQNINVNDKTFGNSENIFINSIFIINFIDNFYLNIENITSNFEENYNKLINTIRKDLIVKEDKIIKYFENIVEYANKKVNSLNYIDKEEEEEEVKFNTKSFLIKSFIVFILSFFISIILTFIIDFFKVYKKEIVG